MDKKIRTPIKLDPTTKLELRAIAMLDDSSMSKTIHHAINAYLSHRIRRSRITSPPLQQRKTTKLTEMVTVRLTLDERRKLAAIAIHDRDSSPKTLGISKQIRRAIAWWLSADNTISKSAA